jgi:penicillin-binding protein 1C
MNIASGGTIAAALVKKIMYVIHPDKADGFKNYRFDPPDGYIPKQICKITGKLAGENTLESVTEWFKPGTEPSEISDVFQETAKARILNESNDQNNIIQKKYFVNIDPKYANWALENNIEITPIKMSEMLGNITPRDINNYQLTITEPVSNIKYFINPTINIELQTIALKVTVNPSVDQVVWYVDGKPFQVADYPYTIRWQLQKGIHSFQVKFPYSNFESNKINVIVE